MKRLLHVISFTTDLEASIRFYRDSIGLALGAHSPYMADFSENGVGLVLLAVHPAQRREVELCFESWDVHAAVDRFRDRGVQFIDELRTLAFGSVIHFRDPEGNLLSLLQPGTGEREAAAAPGAEAAARAGGDPESRAGVAVAAQDRDEPGMPMLSTAIVNAADLSAARAFYGHLLALPQSVESPAWVQYDTGDIRLALWSRRDRNAIDLHHAQPVSFGFTVDALEDWIEAARSRGVEFASVPTDDGFGLTAEIVDPEGNVVVVREPMSEETLEERLAAAWEEDEAPVRAAIRSPARKAERHASWVATRPEYKAAKKPARVEPEREAEESARGLDVVSPRGTGPAGSRQKPKTRTDPKRARAKLAESGRKKKIEGRTIGAKKTAAATRSKSKPVKRAAAKKGGANRGAKKGARRGGPKR